jgi:hypothetical protein
MLGNLPSVGPAAFRNSQWFWPGQLAVRVPSSPERSVAQQSEGRNEAYGPDRKHFERPHSQSQAGLYGRDGTLIAAGAQSVSLNRSDAMDFQVTTAEGDVVKISLAHAQSQSQMGAFIRTTGGFALTATRSNSESLGMEVSIQGELNADETQAIKALLQKAIDVAGAFYSGDTTAAVASGAEMNLKDSVGPIDSFSLSLHSELVRKAVSMYQGIAASTGNQQPSPADSTAAASQSVPSHESPTAPTDSGVTPSKLSPQRAVDWSSAKDFLNGLMALFDGLVHQADSTPGNAGGSDNNASTETAAAAAGT